MRWTIRAKLYTLALIGCVCICLVIASGWWSTERQSRTITGMELLNRALRNHQDSDMMHDAVRADVMSLQLAKDDQERAAAKKDVDHHIGTFRTNVTELRSMELPENLNKEIEDAVPDIEKYLRSAENIFASVSTVQGDSKADGKPAIAAPVLEFSRIFSLLEDKLAHISESLEQSVTHMRVESQEHDQQSKLILLVASISNIVLLLVAAQLVTRRLLNPIQACVVAADRLAHGDLTYQLQVRAHDETGAMAAALGQATSTLAQSMITIRKNAQSLSQFSGELSAISTQMSSTSTETAAQAQSVSTAAETVSRNSQMVASSLEEMSASVKEIAQSTTKAATTAGRAERMSIDNNTAMTRLGSASQEIGEVVKTVAAIAEQTNLLALNATIEAARAGEAGRGFAVVANEVKELARQTAQATEDISHKINAIQSESDLAVKNNAEITVTIKQVADLQQSIAAMVQEQSATTDEMSRNIAQTAGAINEIARNIAQVADSASGTNQAATNTRNAADQMSGLSSALETLIAKFRCS